MNALLLQSLLFLNIFLIGALTLFAAQHAYAHFKGPHHEPEKPRPPMPQLSPEVKERLLKRSEAHFQSVLDHTANELQKELKTTSDQLVKQLDELGSEVVESEMQRYRSDLEELRKQTDTTLQNAQSEIKSHQDDLTTKLEQRRTELEAKLIEEMATEKQRLIQQVDTKIADAVASFLIETLQHNIDLGAQSAYLTSMLEEHKAVLAKEIADEA